MEDLTTGSIPRHLIKLAIPIAIGMVFQTLYYLVDLYFVARIGESAGFELRQLWLLSVATVAIQAVASWLLLRRELRRRLAPAR